MFYNVTCKGISIGITGNLKEAQSWCTSKDHIIWNCKP